MKLLSRKFLSLFLAVLTVTALVPVTAISAFAALSGDFEYRNYSGYATVTGYNGTATDVTIPATIDGYSVNKIKDHAFWGNESIESVTISGRDLTVGNYAFGNCKKLKTVVLEDGVIKVGDSAFSGCSSLESITIPGSVQSVPESLCEGCSSLRSVTFQYGVLTINDNAFKNCSSLVSLSLPNSLTDIETNVFYGCESLCTVTIPESVTWIENTFEGCVKLVEVINHSSLNIQADTTYNGKIALNAISVKTDAADGSRSRHCTKCDAVTGTKKMVAY